MIPCELQRVIESPRQHGLNTYVIITSEIALLHVVHSYEYLLRLLMTLTVMHLDVHLNVLTKKIWF